MVREIKYENITQDSSDRLLERNPNRIPVIITHLHDNLEMKRTKYLVPYDLTVGQLQYVFRKAIAKLDASEAIFIFITKQQIIMPTSITIKQIFDEYNDDGYLKVCVTKENTFG